MDFIKVEGNIYKIDEITEDWVAKVYDYGKEYLKKHDDDERAYHGAYANSREEAHDILERSYKEYTDTDVDPQKTAYRLRNIITNKIIDKIFYYSTLKDHDIEIAFLADGKRFDMDDKNLIMRYREYIQREEHHNRHIMALEEIKDELTRTA